MNAITAKLLRDSTKNMASRPALAPIRDARRRYHELSSFRRLVEDVRTILFG